jgi:LPXTG-site transpeptidase (sortase) family protein
MAGAVATLVTLFVGFNAYILIAEQLNPSGQVYVTSGGERRYLEQPMTLVTPRAGEWSKRATASDSEKELDEAQGSRASDGTAVPISHAQPTPTPPLARSIEVPLPPLRLEIPTIEVNVPVVLADNQNLPRVPLAGWFFKSAFPGTAGNSVLLGHVDGNAAIFGRLNELQAGDTVRVITAERIHIYTVDSAQLVDASAVEVLAPTIDSVVSLITCAGDWNPESRSYNKRLVVRAHYSDVEPRD